MTTTHDPQTALLHQEVEWRRCASDEAHFIENYWHIQHPERGAILMELYPSQHEILETWAVERFTISLKARQIGWTTLSAAHAFWLAFFHADRPIAILSKTERLAIKNLSVAKYGYKRLPKWMLDRGPNLEANNVMAMPFDNGSKIESYPSMSDPLRGETVYLAIVDEWASLNNPEDAYTAIEPATDIGGRIIGISTSKGAGDWFHGTYVKAKAGETKFKSIFVPWWAVPGRDESWFRAKTSDMEPWQRAREYPSDDVECFILAGNPRFDIDTLKRWKDETCEGALCKISMGEVLPDRGGALEIWENADPYERYVIGADVASGNADVGGDWSTAHVIAMSSGLCVARFRGKLEPDQFAGVLNTLGLYYNRALLGVESNHHGGSTLIELKRLRYPRLYYQVDESQRYRKRAKKVGWHTHARSKPLMINELAGAIRDEAITVLCEKTVDELLAYRVDINEKTGAEITRGDPHDDCVISLAIAVMMMRHVTTNPGKDPEPTAGEFTFQWFADTIARDRAPQGRVRSGGRREPSRGFMQLP